MLPEAIQVLETHLPEEEYAEARRIYDWLYENLGEFTEVSKESTSFFENLGTLKGVLDDES